MAHYQKPSISYEEQVRKWIERGLIVNNFTAAVELLSKINYYRLSAYVVPFEKQRDEFKPGTTLEDIIRLYDADEELRFQMMRAISPVEVFFRTRISYEISRREGPFFHYNPRLFRNKFPFQDWVQALEKDVIRAKEKFVDDYKAKYTEDYPKLPIWMATEIMRFGRLSMLYEGLLPDFQRPISDPLEIHHSVLRSWLEFLAYLRNVCAHHCRLWNREFSIRPELPKKDIRWRGRGLNRCSWLLIAAVLILEWIVRKAGMDIRLIEQILGTVRTIGAMRIDFPARMGYRSGREAVLAWG